MNRRGFFAAIGVIAAGKTATAREGLHVQGTLVNDTSDLQAGYFALCGTDTGQCKATDAIGLSVHPKNALYLEPLNALAGRQVQISIYAV
jgi:hypothetical protein